MLLELLAAALVGVAALWLVLHPLLRSQRLPPAISEPLDPEETPRGIALAALKEIDFDRETGKLSDGDHELLTAKYTRVALEALRAEAAGVTPDGIEAMIAARVRKIRTAGAPIGHCTTCGPRPEPDAVFCSTCGAGLSLAPASGAVPLGGTTAPASAT